MGWYPCCCGSIPGPGEVSCSHCDGGIASDELDITVAGLTAGICSGCTDYNGTWTLPFSAPPYGPSGPPCSGDGCFWTSTWSDLGNSDPCSFGRVCAYVEYDSVADETTITVTGVGIWSEVISGAVDCTTIDEYLTKDSGPATCGHASATLRVQSA